jgi:hypothetical protein
MVENELIADGDQSPQNPTNFPDGRLIVDEPGWGGPCVARLRFHHDIPRTAFRPTLWKTSFASQLQVHLHCPNCDPGASLFLHFRVNI